MHKEVKQQNDISLSNKLINKQYFTKAFPFKRYLRRKLKEKWKRGKSGRGRAGEEGNGRTEKQMGEKEKEQVQSLSCKPLRLLESITLHQSVMFTVPSCIAPDQKYKYLFACLGTHDLLFSLLVTKKKYILFTHSELQHINPVEHCSFNIWNSSPGYASLRPSIREIG